MQLLEILFTCHAVEQKYADEINLYITLSLLSHTAVQAGTQVQARDQAGEEAEAAGPR